jgi:hypothetical protein
MGEVFSDQQNREENQMQEIIPVAKKQTTGHRLSLFGN